MWFLTAGEYHVSHNTNNWNGYTVNEPEERHLYWVVGTRDCTEYCESTSPLDEKIFYLEHKPTPYITMMEDELLPVVPEYSKSKFCSFLDLCVSSMNRLTVLLSTTSLIFISSITPPASILALDSLILAYINAEFLSIDTHLHAL
ncbi:hypothetical protein FDENT_8630 [Fusarium denticulatum]|uniref:Uncharacterized protein n=1 Tax=Fusarium denticulatum TaxID=48507 RepID=A0A8H5U4P5_9HYPO|nr:hypothetical protein FDENT_8630 [Fusarium denticulatum]